MIIFSVKAYLDLGIEYYMLVAYRKYLIRFVLPQKLNMGGDLLQFVDLRVGPAYCHEYKVANTNLLVFSCLIFGPAMPILYLCGLIGVANHYIMDRINLTYFYRLPPKYSEKITI